MSDIVPNRELAALEAALKGLTPVAVAIDRDQLFFRAGQESARAHRWLWPSIALFLALTSGTLASLLAVRPVAETIERVVYLREPLPSEAPPSPVPEPSTAPEKETPADPILTSVPEGAPGDYLRLREQVLRWGVDTLPAPAPYLGQRELVRPTSLLDSFPLKS